jgi:hypothetical protein
MIGQDTLFMVGEDERQWSNPRMQLVIPFAFIRREIATRATATARFDHHLPDHALDGKTQTGVQKRYPVVI